MSCSKGLRGYSGISGDTVGGGHRKCSRGISGDVWRLSGDTVGGLSGCSRSSQGIVVFLRCNFLPDCCFKSIAKLSLPPPLLDSAKAGPWLVFLSSVPFCGPRE